MLTRAAGLAATILLIAAPRAEAQESSVRLTIAGGPHAGTYELAHGHCSAPDQSIAALFRPQLDGQAAGQRGLESIEVYTEPGKGKPDGLAMSADFRAKSGKRIEYQIYAIPVELQAPGRKLGPKGRGSVTVQQGESSASATFRGQTADGVRMEGSVKCDKRGSQ
jgi:hypothetical protein